MRMLLTVCLKPTAVCWGALRRALVIVLRASEYSNWMALIRPGCGEEESGSREWRHPNPLANQSAKFVSYAPSAPKFSNFAARKPETPSDVGVRPPTHLCSRGTLPTHCCWPAQGTRTWTPASQPGRTSCSVGSCAAEGSVGWPARRRHAEGWLSGAVHARSFKKKRKNMLKVLNNDFSNCL